MRKIIEAVLAAAILVVGGSAVVVLTGAMPEAVEAPALQVTRAVGIARFLPIDRTAGEAGKTGARPGAGRSEFGGRGGTIITANPVRMVPLVDRVQAVGTGIAAESVTVATPVTGQVETVHFTSNQLVEAGDPLVTLDREAEAIALQSAKAQHAQAKAVNERYQAAGQRSGTFSAAQIEEIATALSVAEAALQQAQFEFERRVIRAPFAGRVGLDDLAVGQHLAAGDEIVRLADTSALEIEFLVPETKAAAARPGTPVRAMSLALPGQVFEGEIEAVDSRIDPETRTLRARAVVPNPDELLTPGMTFSITVPIEGEPMPVVSALSVQWSRDGAFVWRIEGEGVERVPVVIVKREGDEVFVQSGLTDGELVTVEGAQKLNAGSTVSVQPVHDRDGVLTVEVPALRVDEGTAARAAAATQVTR